MKVSTNLDNTHLIDYGLSLIEADWLKNLKNKTFSRLKTQSIPSKKNEEWRYTNTEPLIQKCFELVDKKSISNLKNVKSFTQKSSDNNIFIYYADGKFCFVDKLPPYIKTLRNSDDHENFETLLNIEDKRIHAPFTDLNTLLLSDALIIETLKNQNIDAIIHIIICSDIEQNISPRLQIKLRENSSISIFEHCLTSNSCVINSLTEINCEKNSKLDYFKIIDEQKDGYHLNLSNIKLSKGSAFNFFSWDSGANISRNSINVDLVEENASAKINTLFSPSEKLHIDNQLKIKRIEFERERVRILKRLAKTVLRYSETLRKNFSILCSFDLINAKVKLAKKMRANVFKFSKGGKIRLLKARNPELLLNGQYVVANDILTEKGTFTVVISGPNTGGKTVILKTIGTMALMARAGLLLPVNENSEIPFFPKIYADLGDDQNAAENLSTFSAHLKKMIHILDYSLSGSLVLLDELGNATDPEQGVALAEVILRELNERGISTFVSTHYIDLKTLAQTEEGFTNACMEFNEDESKPTFKLILGAPGGSAALETAKRLGLDSKLIRRAREIYDSNDNRAAFLLESLNRQKLNLERYNDQIQINLNKTQSLKRESEITASRLIKKEKEFEKEKAKRLKKTVQDSKREIRQILDKAKNSKSSSSIKQLGNKIYSFGRSLQKVDLDGFSEWAVPAKELNKGDSVVLIDYGTIGYLLEDPKGKNKLRVRMGNLDSLVDAKKIKGHLRKRNIKNKNSKKELKFTIFLNMLQEVTLLIFVSLILDI